MIRVKIVRGGDGRIRSFTVKGHAYYNDPGKDIVCAGVSSIAVGTVNAIESLTGTVLDSTVKDGFLQASVPADAEGSKPEQIQLLLEAMVVMLTTIEESYGAYITVRDERQMNEEGGRHPC